MVKKIKLLDGTPIYCLKASEAIILDDHIKGYLKYGIAIKDGDVIIDVGANIGVFGLRASQWHRDVQIHSFEPVPDIYDVLKKNASLSKNDRFHSYNMGLGSKADTINFTYFPNSPALSTAHSEMWEEDPEIFNKAVRGSIKNAPNSMWYTKLIPDFMIPMIGKILMNGKKEVTAKVGTLSGFVTEKNLQRINLLKLDCEGHEWEVLQGISEEHWPIIESLVIEIHDIDERASKTESLLREKGFTRINLEKEKALEETSLINLYATR